MLGIDVPPGGGQSRDLPNSPAQRRRLRGIARHGQVGTWAHGVTAALDIRGPVSTAALQAGVDHVLCRRPALRTVFRTDRDTHRISETAATTVRRVTAAGETPAQRWHEAHRLARAEAYRPMPIGQPPLLRAAVFDAGDRHLLVLTMDQLACDAWSANLVVEDVVAAAARAADGRSAEAVEPDGYAQARCVRAAWTDGPPGRQAVARRRSALAGHALRWPPAGPRDPDQGAGPVEETMYLGEPEVSPFLSRVRRSGGSVFSAVALAFALALLKPADRVVLTSTFACRMSKLEESVVGWFANEVAIPLPALAGSVAQNLRALRGCLIRALNDQAAPYELVVGGRPPHGEQGGATVSLLYLPAQLSGADQTSMRIGAAEVDRCRVTLCPTGADVDLYVVEGPAATAGGNPATLSIGAMSGHGGPGREALAGLLARWRDAIGRLGRLDWRTESFWPRDAVSRTPAAPPGVPPTSIRWSNR
jgi:hypothetical protein